MALLPAPDHAHSSPGWNNDRVGVAYHNHINALSPARDVTMHKDTNLNLGLLALSINGKRCNNYLVGGTGMDLGLNNLFLLVK